MKPIYDDKLISILFIETGTLGGGSSYSLTQHLEAINKNHFKPVVACLKDNPNVALWRKLGVKIYTLNNSVYSIKNTNIIDIINSILFSQFLKYFNHLILLITKLFHQRSITEIGEIISQNNIKIVHLNINIYRDLFAAVAAHRSGVRCVSHLRSMRKIKLSNSFLKFVNENIDYFISNSQANKKYWSSLGIEDKKIRVIYNAINLYEGATTQIRKEFSIPNRFDKIIGCVASLYDSKGHHYLLDGFAELISKANNYFLLIIGDGPLKGELISKSKQLGIDQNILFVGYHKNALALIKSLDILIVPSKNESFGRSIIEGMSTSTPIIATNVGGIPEIITNRKTGLLIKYGDISGFINAIELMDTNSKLRRKMVLNAYKKVQNKFMIDKYIKSMNEIYYSILIKK